MATVKQKKQQQVQAKEKVAPLRITNPVTEYNTLIITGKVVVSEKVRKVYAQLAEEIKNPRGQWVFDLTKAMRPIEFIEKFCRHSKGKWARKPVVLELWQKAIVAAAFGFVDKKTRLRRFQKVDLYVARKNGKSTLSAALALYLLIADGEHGAEIYSAATKRDQAKIIWSEAKNMVAQSPDLTRRIRRTISEIAFDKNFSMFKPLSSDSGTQDGLNPSGAFIDELHAMKGRELIDVIVDGMSAREQPFTMTTSTMGTVRESVFDETYEYDSNVINGQFQDDRLLAIVYELDRRDEWLDPKCWPKANPGLGTIKSLETLKDKVEVAKQDHLKVKNLLCKDFNIRETAEDSWLTFDEANNEETFDIGLIKNMYGIGGNDLGATTDLTFACTLVMLPGSEKKYIIGMGFMPKDVVAIRSKEDKVPYDVWVERGYITTCPGRKVDYRYVTDWYVEMKEKYGIIPFWNHYDSWNSPAWVEDMEERMGYEKKKSLLPCIMGAKTLSAPMKDMKGDLSDNLIVYNNNPLIKWALTNVAIETDKNENIRPIKGKNQRQRIDPAVAILIAYTGLVEHMLDYKSLIGW